MPPETVEMSSPLVLFGIFALLSAVGSYLITAHLKGRRAGIVAALVTVLFFAALLFGVLALIRQGQA